jgi:hypothetical protein
MMQFAVKQAMIKDGPTAGIKNLKVKVKTDTAAMSTNAGG